MKRKAGNRRPVPPDLTSAKFWRKFWTPEVQMSWSWLWTINSACEESWSLVVLKAFWSIFLQTDSEWCSGQELAREVTWPFYWLKLTLPPKSRTTPCCGTSSLCRSWGGGLQIKMNLPLWESLQSAIMMLAKLSLTQQQLTVSISWAMLIGWEDRSISWQVSLMWLVPGSWLSSPPGSGCARMSCLLFRCFINPSEELWSPRLVCVCLDALKVFMLLILDWSDESRQPETMFSPQ